MPIPPPGCLEVLNCGDGHMRFEFDKDDPTEVERAKRVISDMMARGYSIFVETDGGLRKVKRFDPKSESYILADVPGDPVPKGKASKRKGVPLKSGRATGVAPTAGG